MQSFNVTDDAKWVFALILQEIPKIAVKSDIFGPFSRYHADIADLNWAALPNARQLCFSGSRGSSLDSNVLGIHTRYTNSACLLRRGSLLSCEADTPGHCYHSRRKLLVAGGE
jgi:hypothetical protein